MQDSLPVLVLYDAACRCVWISRVAPPQYPENCFGLYPWHSLSGESAKEMQAAFARVLSDRQPTVVDSAVDGNGVWRTWLFFCKAGTVRVAAYAAQFPPSVLEMTDREREVCALLAQGLSTKEIARSLKVSRSTVDNHRYNVCKKLDLTHGSLVPFCGAHLEWLAHPSHFS